jgi:hypothetical protein
MYESKSSRLSGKMTCILISCDTLTDDLLLRVNVHILITTAVLQFVLPHDERLRSQARRLAEIQGRGREVSLPNIASISPYGKTANPLIRIQS